MTFNFSLNARGNANRGRRPASISSGSLVTRSPPRPRPRPPATSVESRSSFSPDGSLPSGTQTPPGDNWEPVDLSSTEYARMRREMMQLISDLRSLGGDTVLDLPSIVVIGGQSAGKSSLVEAVSGVSVPRDSGTCTRCPTECTMSSNATTWSCKIKLRFDYDSSGCSAAEQKEVSFGPTITDRSEVDVWLRRAQAAILNPNIAPESFYRRSIQDLKDFTHMLKFSRNVISIFIEDPDATDLSFVDLPGLIQNEDPEVLELVQQLTESYISRQNTIILTTIPMSDDMQNQQSVRLAREADPDGDRTIGVLTKPDTLGAGAVNSRRSWLDVIEGRQHQLKHGYYCVRLPDDTQRAERLSRSALQRIAAEYFDTTSPWNGVSNRGRFGIPAFVSDISVLLVNHISKAIPQLKEDVERLLSSCLRDISTLPAPLETDPQIEVLARVNAFCDAFKGVVSGTSSDKKLAQRNRALYATFAQSVRGTSPDFRPFELPTSYLPIYDLEPEERAIEPMIGSADTMDAGARDPNIVIAPSPTFHELFIVRNDMVQTMGVYDVRKTILDSIAWELPGNVPYEAKTRLIKRLTVLWSAPAERCLTSIHDVLDNVIKQLVETHFGRFKVLQGLISDLIRPDVEEHKQKALVAIKETLGLEMTSIYTQNLKDFKNLREKWLAKYRYARKHPEEYRLPITPDEDGAHSWFNPTRSVSSLEQSALNYLAQAGYRDLTVEDLTRLSNADQFDDELTVMADVRAYFTIACKRIIDHVPLKIEQSLHQALAEKLSINLLQRLMADTTSTGDFGDRMRELVSEDPATEAKRIRLQTLCHRLQEMKRKIADFATQAM